MTGQGLPALTFVIPAHDAAGTIGVTLRSLQDQSRTDWEAVVVDDGSTDRTAALVTAVQQADPRIRLVRIAHGGAGRARNAGLSEARGAWVTFLDADDWVATSYVERMLEAAGKSDAEAVYSGYRRVLPNGSGMDFFDAELEEAGFAVLARHCATCIHSLMVRRETLEAAGGFDPALRLCEDWDLWQRIARRGVRFTGVQETLAFYRTSEGSLSGDHRQMLVDGLTVQRRGHGEDPRVRDPSPALASGTGPELLQISHAFLAVWCAAAEVGAGREGADLLDQVDRPLPMICHEAGLVTTIVEALATGGAVAPEALALHVPSVQRALYALLEAMAREQPRRGMDRGLAYLLERRLLDALPPGRSATLQHTAKVVVTPGRAWDVPLPPTVDRVLVDFVRGGERLFRQELPVFGALTADDLVALASRFLDPNELVDWFDVRRSRRYYRLGAAASARRIGREAAGAPWRRSPRRLRVRTLVRTALDDVARDLVAGGSSSPLLRRLAEIDLPTGGAPAVPQAPVAEDTGAPQDLGRRTEQWEEVFAEPDPWGYESEYETRKYDRTLELLPPGGIGRALELACAEGHFTRRLAGRVENLVAADISARAVERAAERCGDLPNVGFTTLDVTRDQIPGGQDLVVASEFLYYLDGLEELAVVAARIRDALAPGGAVVMANHFLLRDDMGATGFDWDQEYGGKVIHETFLATPGLALEASIVTELYRVDRFRRVASDAAVPEPAIHRVDLDSALEPRVARFAVWGGATARRREVEHQPTWHVPVLMYHRVATDGPPELARWRVPPATFQEQLRLLRSNGYRSTSSQEILRHRRSGVPLYGRPVLITFDDGYQDFADTAWPILQANDFTAEVFLVTDRVGGTSSWDESFGPPAPLMDWPTIEQLSREGIVFASHLATHTAATDLSSDDLLLEAVRSRRTISERTGVPVEAVAAPYGAVDDRLEQILGGTGYEACYSTEWAVADIRKTGVVLPRAEVPGHWSVQDLAAALNLDGKRAGDG